MTKWDYIGLAFAAYLILAMVLAISNETEIGRAIDTYHAVNFGVGMVK